MAVRWTGDNRREIWDFCTLCYFNTDFETLELKLILQSKEVNIGDYIVKEPNGDYTVYDPESFKANYIDCDIYSNNK